MGQEATFDRRGCRRHSLHQARRAICWAVCAFVFLQATAAISVERLLPDARDPEFRTKEVLLKAQLQEAPDRPLILMIGSSRTGLGLKAQEVQLSWDGTPAQMFNFGLSGGGPFLELLTLQRLLTGGIKPALVLIEVLPPVFNDCGNRPLEEVWLQSGRMRLSEIKQLGHYSSDPVRLLRRWGRARLLPWSSLNRTVQGLLDPNFVGIPVGPGLSHVEPDGWEPHFLNGITAEQRLRYLEIAKEQYHDSMGEFHLARQPVAALHAVLQVCRHNGIPAVLVMMPEGTHFKAFYPARLRERLTAYVVDLSRREQTPLIDASDWLSDEDLWDAHHPLPSGARLFTQRLGHVLQPLLSGLSRRSGGRPAEAHSSLKTTSSSPVSRTCACKGVFRES
jgi:hypothetical protein